MTLILTPEVLRASYDFLNSTIPFSRWNLPEGEDVRFKVVRSRSLCGYHDNGKPGKRKLVVAVSCIFIKTNAALVLTIAHEMCHVHQFRHFPRDPEHGPAFKRLADQVCKIHGFDRGLF